MDDASIGVVINPADSTQILWVKRRDLPIWVLPGGGIDTGETPERACLREVEEESGVKVSIVQKTTLLLPVSRFTATTHIYLCQVEQGTPSPQSESEEAKYFPLSHPPSPHFPLHDEWAREAFTNRGRGMIKRPLLEFSWIRVGCFFLAHPTIAFRYVFIRFLKKMGIK